MTEILADMDMAKVAIYTILFTACTLFGLLIGFRISGE